MIDDNLVTDEDINRIIENEILRRKIIDLRDNSNFRDPGMVIHALIGFTENLKE